MSRDERRYVERHPKLPHAFTPALLINQVGTIANGIEEFKSDLGYLMLLDGTGYFSSTTIHCKNCSTKTDKKGNVIYFHSCITPVLAKPRSEYVLSLTPEYIRHVPK